eukprot:scaffold19375_cov103-Isochrysis_galbana.AAC.2
MPFPLPPRYSGPETRDRAALLAAEIGAVHTSISIDKIRAAFCQTFEEVEGADTDTSHDEDQAVGLRRGDAKSRATKHPGAQPHFGARSTCAGLTSVLTGRVLARARGA